MRSNALLLGLGMIAGAASLTACGSADAPAAQGALTKADGGGRAVASAALKTADGAPLGTVEFFAAGEATRVSARITSLPAGAAANAFHGMHLHANADPANGEGCVADPAKPSNTWFTSADGHWNAPGATGGHGQHSGDLTPVLVSAQGTATVTSETGRIDPKLLPGLVVIFHAGPDNLGNIPVGAAPEQYTANSPAALDVTAKTGNAVDRLACGVVVAA